jgi:anti-sigma factor RsiW
MTHHPEDRLRAFAMGELGDHLAALVAEHLDECPRCANLVLRHDPLARAFASVDDLTPPADLVDRVLAAAVRPAEADAPIHRGVDRASAWAGVALLAAAAALGAAHAAWHPGSLITAARALQGVGQVLLHAAADPRIAPALAASVALVGTSALLTARPPDLRRTA